MILKSTGRVWAAKAGKSHTNLKQQSGWALIPNNSNRFSWLDLVMQSDEQSFSETTTDFWVMLIKFWKAFQLLLTKKISPTNQAGTDKR